MYICIYVYIIYIYIYIHTYIYTYNGPLSLSLSRFLALVCVSVRLYLCSNGMPRPGGRSRLLLSGPDSGGSQIYGLQFRVSDLGFSLDFRV